MFKLFHLNKSSFEEGIDLSAFKSAHKSEPQISKRGMLASYPIYPSNQVSIVA